MEDLSSNCYHCGAQLGANDFGRRDSCSQCGRDTKACKNCFFYDPNYNNDCRETQADRVLDKERFNFCDYFRPKRHSSDRHSSQSNPERLREAAETLFKKR